MIKRYLFVSALFLISMLGICAQQTSEIKVVEVTDVHGSYFPSNYLTGKEEKGSLARVMTLLRQLRETNGDNVVLVDNGDILQGQPTAYYYNYEDTISPHLASLILDYMGCEVTNLGNHDIETGHPVYDRWAQQCQFPVLGANIVDEATGAPYFQPYAVTERDGIKIAFLGMISPAIPSWLPHALWSGLSFEDAKASCQKWVPVIKAAENPDFIVVLLHAGQNESVLNGVNENPATSIAQEVGGIDAVLFGHDHRKECKKVYNVESSDSVLMLNAGYQGLNAGVMTLKAVRGNDGKIISKNISGELIPMSDFEPDSAYMAHFAPYEKIISDYVSMPIGELPSELSSKEALAGANAFMETIHRLQLQVSDSTKISIAAPLSLNAVLSPGPITVRDMFNLYKYENQLYTMLLTGQEIKDLLEYSYDMWINKTGIFYNYDSAFGIDYTVDPKAEKGERVVIAGFSDSTEPFLLDQTYRVAVNSYRGNGGGNLLTLGSGIPREELSSRVIASTDKDLRYYLMQQIKEDGGIQPICTYNWRFLKEE